ncbi:50S ribosomal protein L29 [Candidatus Daviesbacteria bacterium]|nr:50S ribosomal protein L29 [Candidatus Daviesbacteria bacterium]
MKKNELKEVKALDEKSLFERIKKINSEIADLVLDKNMNKLKNLKSIFKKRKDLAQVLTILRQKQLLSQMENSVSAAKKEKEGDKAEQRSV